MVQFLLNQTELKVDAKMKEVANEAVKEFLEAQNSGGLFSWMKKS